MISFPTISLQPGATGNSVKQLQDWLVQSGYMTPAEVATGPGIYGPKTTAAVNRLQKDLGVDNSSGPGYFGPRTLAAIQATTKSQPKTEYKSDPAQPFPDSVYDTAVANHPIIKKRIESGNTLEQIQNAAVTGDLSSLKNEYGQPFSLQEQQDALAKAMDDNKLFYESQQAKEQADTENALAQKKSDFQDYLLSSGEKFAQEKTNLDQNAADTGMLFSTSRKQKEQKLQNSYERDQASRKAGVGRDISGIAQDYQYKYGNDAANTLSQYYNLGSNSYNPNVATGGVTTGGISSVYNPNKFNFQGTSNVSRKAAANVRAAGYLGNKGNKLLSTSYNNQF